MTTKIIPSSSVFRKSMCFACLTNSTLLT